MDRRRSSKPDLIATAARELFLAQGYAATSMDAVTDAAGVSKQTVYSYFPGKADLLRVVISKELAQLARSDGPDTAPTSQAELRNNLLSFAEALTTRLLQPDTQALLRLVFGEALRMPELAGLVAESLPLMLLDEVQAIILDAVAAGLIKTERPDLAARMFLGPLMSFVALDGLFSDEPPNPPDAATREFLVDAFLDSVRISR